MWFESFVNSDRCKAGVIDGRTSLPFESFVNSDRCKAEQGERHEKEVFESFVLVF